MTSADVKISETTADNSLKCGCKGIRKCAICHPILSMSSSDIFPTAEENDLKNQSTYAYCIDCCRFRLLTSNNRAKLGKFLLKQSKFECICDNDDDKDALFRVDGVYVRPEFIDVHEEAYLAEQINTQNRWVESQSGRFKQDFGPKANFNKRKLKFSTFTGLPNYSRSLISRLGHEIPILNDFVCIDLCNLKYDSSRAACIDPHFDDMWLWGDRLVTVNLKSNTFLTLHSGKDSTNTDTEILIPMERRSLLVLSRDARYKWMHSIKKEHIVGMRWAITLREASDEYKNGEFGLQIERLAKTYSGVSVGTVEDFFKIENMSEPNLSQSLFDIEHYLTDQNKLNEILAKVSPNFTEYEYLEKDSNKARIKVNDRTIVDLMFTNDLDLLNCLKGISEEKFLGFVREKFFLFDNLFVCVENETYEDNRIVGNSDETFLFEVGKLIAEWRAMSSGVKSKTKCTNVKNPIFIVDDFHGFKSWLHTTLKNKNLDLSIKSKFLATIYNIKAMSCSNNEQIGYILGDFKPENVYASLKLKTHFSNIERSFLLNDVAIFYTNYLLAQLLTPLSSLPSVDAIKKSLTSLWSGYTSSSSDLGNLNFLKFLILFHLQSNIFDTNIQKLIDVYQILYELDLI